MGGGDRFLRLRDLGRPPPSATPPPPALDRIVYLGGLGRTMTRAVPPPVQPPRGRPGARRRPGAGHRAAGRHHHRLGSASFEMLRYLVEVLPVMVTPRWVATAASRSPSATSDLPGGRPRRHAARRPRRLTERQVLEIGGPDALTYREMMQIYAEVAGLRTGSASSPVPLLTPKLSSLWSASSPPCPPGWRGRWSRA